MELLRLTVAGARLALPVALLVLLPAKPPALAGEPAGVGASGSRSPEEGSTTYTVGLPLGATMEFVWIPPGEFMMGSSPDERGRNPDEDRHKVVLETGFWMGKYEVTQGQWYAVTGQRPQEYSVRTGLEFYGKGDDFPVYMVSWNDITRIGGFLDLLNDLGQGTFRLPSEAEWEYACRAGSRTRYSFGDALECGDGYEPCDLFDPYMWYYGNNGKENTLEYTTKPVGRLRPNAFGLYDMHGNILEWCQDRYHPSYEGAPADGSAWNEGSLPVRVLRGGMWNDEARRCRSACRSASYPDNYSRAYGLRLVRER